ncbi:MAG: hypothetical protein ACREJC_19525, partial [Tepidisphaeraceae bacterium]
MNGFGGLLRRYGAALVVNSDGVNEHGYGLYFQRGDENYSDSRVLLYDGTSLLQSFYPSFQFGASIDTVFTVRPDGSVTGSLSSDGNAFNFAFGPHAIQSTGTNFAYFTGGPDTRSSTITFPRLDDVALTNVPEPGGLLSATCAAVGCLAVRRKRSSSPSKTSRFEPLESRQLMSVVPLDSLANTREGASEFLDFDLHHSRASQPLSQAASPVTFGATTSFRGRYKGNWAIYPTMSIPFQLNISYQRGTRLRGRFYTGVGSGYFELSGAVRGTNKFSIGYAQGSDDPYSQFAIRVRGTINGGKISGYAIVATGLQSIEGKISGRKTA